MKKVTFMLVAIMAFCVSIAACAKKKEANNMGQKEESKILVAYFSATGTTERAAKMVAAATGGELYKIQPKEEYTAADLDWTVKTSRSSKENDNPDARPAIVKNKESLDTYDVIYLGYPNWWNIAPRIINTFIETYGLKGKTVIPFMTSGGSQISNSVNRLKKTYPDINWKDGKLLNNVSQGTIDTWVKSQK